MDNKLKALEISKAADGKMAFLMTSGALDRDGEILDPDGMMAEDFMKNPVFLWSHDLFGPPLGNVTGLKRTEAGWEAEVTWATPGIYPFADTIRGLYEDNILHAVSVRFRPTEWEAGRMEKDGYNTKFTKWELLELSAVNVPANQEAVRVRGADGVRQWAKSIMDAVGTGPAAEAQPPRDLAEDGSAEHSQAAAGATLTVDAEAAASSYYCVVLDENGQPPKDYTDAWKDGTISWNDDTGIHTSKIEFFTFDDAGTKWININGQTKVTDAGAVPPAEPTDAAEAAAHAAPPAPAQGTPGAESGAESKTDDGGIGLDDLCGEPEPIEIDEAALTERVNAEIERQLAERKAYLSGRSAVAHLLPEN